MAPAGGLGGAKAAAVRGWSVFEIEQIDEPSAQEEHRGRELDRVDVQHRDARLGHRSIDRVPAVDEAVVELLGERLRRGVGDLELHRDHGALALLHQHRRDAREGIVELGPRSIAGVEHDELQGVLATDQLGDRVGGHLLPLPVLVAEQEDRIALGSERTVPDEMQDVEGVLQLSLERLERAVLEPLEIDLVLALLQRLGHPLLLARDVEIAHRVGDDAEHADLALHDNAAVPVPSVSSSRTMVESR